MQTLEKSNTVGSFESMQREDFTAEVIATLLENHVRPALCVELVPALVEMLMQSYDEGHEQGKVWAAENVREWLDFSSLVQER